MAVTSQEATSVSFADSGSGEVRSVLVSELRLKFIRIARWKNIPQQDVDDVVNDGVEKLLRNLVKFRGDGPLDHFAAVLFSNVCEDYYRRRKRDTLPQIMQAHCADTDESSTIEQEVAEDSGGDPTGLLDSRRSLRSVLSILDRVITETASSRRNMERDAEIARLGLRNLLEPRENDVR